MLDRTTKLLYSVSTFTNEGYTVLLSDAHRLCSEGAIEVAVIVPVAGAGWYVWFHGDFDTSLSQRLYSARNQIRVFRSVDAAVKLLYSLPSAFTIKIDRPFS